MKTLKVSAGRYRVLQNLTRKDISVLKKHPQILGEAKHVVRSFRKVIKRVEALSEYANRRKRQTAYKRITAICAKAIERLEKK